MTAMASSEENRFRVRPSPPKARSGPRAKGFVSQVLKAVSKTGAKASGARGARPASTFGRGRIAASLAGRHLGADARRVVIKSRFVVLKRAGAKAVSTHLRYIERDGVMRDGQKGVAYGADTDAADLKGFEERGRGDRHQFRFIVSPEDAVEIEDLQGFTRRLMQRMAVDLETKLDWVAVDHWDTDNPHTHIVLRGWAGSERKGQDLVIAPDYMAHGIRLRASEIATEWLGPRTEAEMRHGLQRELEQQRFTSLDRALLRQATVDIVDLTDLPKPGDSGDGRQRQTLLRARLQRLEAMALAERVDAHSWRLAPGMEQTLAAMGERGDILRAMHRAMKGEQRELVMEAQTAAPVIGRIVAKGLADELHDRGYLVVDGTDGRAQYLKLPAGADLSGLPVGGIVEARSPMQEKAVDRNILAAARGDIYSTVSHLAQLEHAQDRDPQGAVDAHVRRLEALRRSGVVERVGEGVWKIPDDFLQKAQQHDAQKHSGVAIELRSHLPVESQVRAIGATWLDRNLVGDGPAPASQGFGAQVREALSRRVDFLAEQGLAQRRGQRVVLARNLLATLRDRELAETGKALQAQTGQAYRPTHDGQQVSGIYRRSIQLNSGRFAMLDDGIGFSLVPWRPVIEQRLGQQISAVVRGSSATWHVGRSRGLSV
jgi:type IV secretory pathway VirD2 relaxase